MLSTSRHSAFSRTQMAAQTELRFSISRVCILGGVLFNKSKQIFSNAAQRVFLSALSQELIIDTKMAIIYRYKAHCKLLNGAYDMTRKCFLLTADVLPPHEDPWPTAGAQFQPYPAPAAEYSPAHFDRVDHPLSEVSQLQCHQNAQTLLLIQTM